MSNLGFNPVAVSLSFIEGLQKSATWLFDAKADPRDEGGQPVGDGLMALQYAVSIGKGRGSTKVELSGADLAPVAEALRAFDPEADLSHLPPAECIARTITREKDGSTTFKVSLAPNSRRVTIPAGQWDNYCALMQANADSAPAAVEYYRNIVDTTEAPTGGDE